MRPLTPKQQAFVAEYAIDCNATQAAIRAGYSKRTAQEQSARLLSNVMVGEAVRKALDAKAERTKIDADWVMGKLEKEATFDGEGSSHSARVSALATMAKTLGMMKDRVEVTGKDGGPIETSDMTEEERAKRLMVLLRRHQERISSVPVGRDDTPALGSDDAGGESGSV
jgi:phage terminase small subunit